MISAEIAVTAQFGDVDPMHVVWHGTYVRYLEQARSALMDIVGYNYVEMDASGYAWPIVDLRLKYVKPIRLLQKVAVAATIVEYENRLKIDYLCRDFGSREILTKASTIQVALKAATFELCFECPVALTGKIHALLGSS
jgi:acyl-CoA thioester hydrolase